MTVFVLEFLDELMSWNFKKTDNWGMEDEEVTITQINNALNHHKSIFNLLKIFVEQNANPQHSPNLDPLSRVLVSCAGKIVLPLLETFKILLRKEENRTSLPPLVLKSIRAFWKMIRPILEFEQRSSNVYWTRRSRETTYFFFSHTTVYEFF